ncbi:serine/threonine-protein kinase [Embleya scabrispora]|uniref:serine/threonine-protein kinase n=1 Tax=Embleya scabrispora TaxID=159449 RepID=UPI00038059D0|nr:protein kinase [Embleya scabrispora]MYS80253.1 serine/threonine protein kinase [Streptomyces sp. SID5474]
MDPLKPGDPGVVGRYRLSARLGQGGLGAVFLGRAPGGEHVTVKLVRPDLASDTTFVERFRKDVTTAQEVGGTHVAHVLDADPDGTPPWLVVEHVAGPSLETAVAAHGPLPEHTLRALGAGLAEGLAAIHEAGLTHRDLKPANVLLAADGPRVADYALARALGSAGMTRTGVVDVPGLPAPEQVTGGSIGPAIDVFALGGVLCHAAGVAPFGAGSVAEIAQKVVREMPDLTELPDWLREIVADCLKKRPTARPSAADLVARFAAADPGVDWLPDDVAALSARSASAGVDTGSDSGSDSASGAAERAGSGDGDEAEDPETAEVPAPAAPATTEPADADSTPVATPAKRTAEGRDAEAEDDATPVATPAVRAGGKGAKKPAAKADADRDDNVTGDEGDATPVATPAARAPGKGAGKATSKGRTGKAGAEDDAKSATPAAAASADEADDATPVATPAVRTGGKSTKKPAATPGAPADDDATPVATPAVRTGKKSTGKPAATSDTPADDATPAAKPAVGTDDDGRGVKSAPGAGRVDPDADATTPVATPAVPIGKDDDAPAADKPAAKEPYDGGAPVRVPAIRRGTAAETVKVARDPDSPAPGGTDDETVKVAHGPGVPARGRTDDETVKVAHGSAAPAPPRLNAWDEMLPAAPPIPAGAPVAAAPQASPLPTGTPFPPAPGPATDPRPANPVIWHAVIALLGVTAVGIGLFRLTDSAWREAQNVVLGVILPGISVLAGLAGLAALVSAVLAVRGKAAAGSPPSPGTAPAAEHTPAGADQAR